MNWDGAGARPFNNQDHFPTDFFNNNVKAGLVYDEWPRFATTARSSRRSIRPYADQFKPFSPEGDVLRDRQQRHRCVVSMWPARRRPPIVTGFGVVLSDVDLAQTTSVELFDKDGTSLGRYSAPVRSDANGLSFVGVKFDVAIVARVKITCGNGALGAGVNDVSSGGASDLVVVDNVIYGEPQAF